jgi:hypothetical protein
MFLYLINKLSIKYVCDVLNSIRLDDELLNLFDRLCGLQQALLRRGRPK